MSEKSCKQITSGTEGQVICVTRKRMEVLDETVFARVCKGLIESITPKVHKFFESVKQGP